MMLCGDEVQAAVMDFGNDTVKCGTAGQDLPRHIFRSAGSRNNKEKMLVGDNALRSLPDNTEALLLSTQNQEINWDVASALLKDCLEQMHMTTTDCPLLFAEGVFGSFENKIKLSEIVFEELQSPAMYMSSNGTLASFGAGRATSLVIDFGAAHTTISPVVDGYQLRKSTVRLNKGGNNVDDLLQQEIQQQMKQPITPWHDRQNKLKLDPTTTTLRHLFVRDVVKDLKWTMCFIPHKPISVTFNSSQKAFMESLLVAQFELPDGTMVAPQYSLCAAAETIFFPIAEIQRKRNRQEIVVDLNQSPHLSFDSFYGSITELKQPSQSQQQHEPLQYSILRSLSAVDVDARRELMGNIVLTGAASTMDGVTQRLTHELTEMLPPQFKTKFVPTLPVEKQYGSWIGGSILSICGSFQQLWASKREYEERGAENMVKKYIH